MLRQQKLIGLRGISIPVPQRLSFSESQNDFNAKPDAYANGNNRLTFSFLTLDVNTTYFNGLPHSQFHASSLFVFCAATNKSDFRQIAEASPNPLWIPHLALHLALNVVNIATLLCVLSVNRYRVYSTD